MIETRAGPGRPWRSPPQKWFAALATARPIDFDHLAAPEAALESMLESSTLDDVAARQLEAEGLARLFGSPVNAALLNVFFLTDRNKMDPGLKDATVAAKAIESVGVVGAGIMGSGISAANIRRGIPVVLSDADVKALRRGSQSVLEEAAYDRVQGAPTAKRMSEAATLLNVSTADQEFTSCGLVIEAVVETLDVKRGIYRRLEPLLGTDAFLASNTSTIPISRLAENLSRPERFCGIHFFNPVRRMKLVEVIRGKQSSGQNVSRGCIC